MTEVDDWFASHRDALGSDHCRHQARATSSASLSDDLLARFKSVPLLDEYDVYEQLMTYWHETHARRRLPHHERGLGRRRQAAQDDRGQGPQALRDARPRHRLRARAPASTRWISSRPTLIVARYFADEQAKVDELTTPGRGSHPRRRGVHRGARRRGWPARRRRWTTTRSPRHWRRHGSRTPSTKAPTPTRSRRFEHLIELYNAEAAAKKAVKEAQADLDLATLKKYGDLTEADVKSSCSTTSGQRNGRNADRRRGQLAHARLSWHASSNSASVTPRPSDNLDAELDELEAKVAEHLAEMGVS